MKQKHPENIKKKITDKVNSYNAYASTCNCKQTKVD